ncbi:hypothetical protein ACWKW6_09055 [Dyadobacter jiangsuensis]
MPHIGWIGEKRIKIYTNEAADCFYLHDEMEGRMFEFECNSQSVGKHLVRYDQVLQDYVDWRGSKIGRSSG